MSDSTARSATDWTGSIRTYAGVWGIPIAVMVAGLLVDVPARTALWTIALVWKGTACLLNARRCGRTHCRYTGPFYLVMILPVLALGSGMVSSGFYGWVALGAVVIIGSKVIWWATERAWGRFS
jgi:hypothetical protein